MADSFADFLDEHFPNRHPCLMCGREGAEVRHRELDAIAGRVRAGEPTASVAEDYGRPVWVVERVAREWTVQEA